MMILDTGSASVHGKHDINEDACLSIYPGSGRHEEHGALLAVADGMSGLPDGREAARCATKTLRDAYYSAPDGWGLEHALKESFQAANHAVRTQGEKGRASTMSALILRQRRWGIGHAGDTRVYLFRDNQLKQLTNDHIVPHMTLGYQVTRACGLDEQINIDVRTGELAEGDIFVITSDGVHKVLTGAILRSSLISQHFAQEIAQTITQRALEAGSTENISACVVRVDKLPSETKADVMTNIAALPIREKPRAGETIDNFRVEGLIHRGRMARLYKAKDLESGQSVILKFPIDHYADDPKYIEYFQREEWIGKRINSPYLIETLPLKTGRRTALYTVMSYNSGKTLAKRIHRKNGLTVDEAVSFTKQLLTAVEHLHRKGVIHRDVKPENILVERHTHRLRLLELGLSHIERWHDKNEITGFPVGTPSYMAPELFAGKKADERADVFSTGITLYEMLTQQHPYGYEAGSSTPDFRQYLPVETHHPDIPPWLARVIEKACAVDPVDRYPTAVDFANALSDPPTLEEAVLPPRRLPMLQRLPMQHWKMFFVVSLLVNVVIFLVLAIRSG